MERGLRVQVASLNAGGHFDGSAAPDLTEWLVPSISEDEARAYSTGAPRGDLAPREAPDVYAVAFQEFAPLHAALAGRISRNLARVDKEIRRAVRVHQAVVRSDRMYDPLERGGGPENYCKLAEVNHAGLTLYVYARERAPQTAKMPSAAVRVREVRVARVGTGLGGLLGNKGAVGARVVLQALAPGGPDEVLTFVGAHLTAHEHLLARRNADWRAIVERLVFSPADVQPLPIVQVHSSEGPLPHLPKTMSQEPQARPASALDDRSYSLYDTHYLFVQGDLNYRIATGGEKGAPPTSRDVQLAARSPDTWAALAPYDQLVQQRAASHAFHALEVPDMGAWRVPPTYKYKKHGRADELSPKRAPAWTDRLLWGARMSAAVRCELYRSVMRYTISDHKPITAILELPVHAQPAEFLAAPWPIDPRWRLWRALGDVADRIVGYAWSALLLLGNGHLGLAVLELALLTALAAYWLQYGLLPGAFRW